MYMLYHTREVYIIFILTKPEGVARGRGEYKCDIHRAGVV